ncbi:MAG: hypothetical protein OHK0029_41810 [Armatimonadaceae bacterium]
MRTAFSFLICLIAITSSGFTTPIFAQPVVTVSANTVITEPAADGGDYHYSEWEHLVVDHEAQHLLEVGCTETKAFVNTYDYFLETDEGGDVTAALVSPNDPFIIDAIQWNYNEYWSDQSVSFSAGCSIEAEYQDGSHVYKFSAQETGQTRTYEVTYEAGSGGGEGEF